MVDGCCTGDLGQNLAKPLLNIEVSSLVRVQEDRFSYTVVIFLPYLVFVYVDYYDHTFWIYKISYW